MSVNFSNLILIDYLSLVLMVISFLYFQLSILNRSNDKSTLSRAFLSFVNSLLFISVIGLIVQPEFKSVANNELKEVRIITKSANTDIDSMIDDVEENRKNTFILTDVKASLLNKSKSIHLNRNVISSPSQLPIRISNVTEGTPNGSYSLEVIGDGFNNQQIVSINKDKEWYFQRIVYEPPTNKAIGIINPTWNVRINLGDHSLFTAEFQGENLGDIKDKNKESAYVVRLLNPSGQLEEKKTIFNNEVINIRIVPKTFGLMTYKIEVLKGDTVISQETIAIEVTNQVNLKMLILQSSPSFETKQMKNWAGDNQAVVVVNTSINPKVKVSRLTNVEEKNRKKYKSMNISEIVLKDFDVLTIDSRRFGQLSVAHKKAIMNSIDDGLGVILLVGEDSLESTLPFSESDKGSFTINKSGQESQSILTIETINDTSETSRHLVSELPISHIADSFQFVSSEGKKNLDNKLLTPLISNSKKQILVAQLNIGLGKVSYNLLKDTYRWVSNGEKVAHSQLWQHLIKTTARNRKDSVGLINESKRLIVGNKEHLCVSTDLIESELHPSEIRSLRNNEISKILFNRVPILNNQYCTNYWAGNSGWHQMKIGKRNRVQDLSFYVYPKESWIADIQNSKIISTSHYKEQINNRNNIMTSKSTIRFRKIELWLYWMLIISSLSYIWVERKYTD